MKGVFPAAPGSPWPDATNGEVIGPSGRRCYKPARAAEVVGAQERTFRNWMKDGKHPTLILDCGPADTGGRRIDYLLADGVEALARELGRWPPSTSQVPDGLDATELADLLRRQGRDLDQKEADLRAREREIASLTATVERLEQERDSLIRQRDKWIRAAAAATAAAAEGVEP